MSESTTGLDALDRRLERRSRSVPPPRHPRPPAAVLPATPPPVSAEPGPVVPVPVEEVQPALPASPAGAAPTRSVHAGGGAAGAPRATAVDPRPLGDQRPAPDPRPTPAPGEPAVANLAVRIRRTIDRHVDEIVFRLKQEGVRTSKAELVEMVLWELPASPAEVRPRLRDFRDRAPREGRLDP